MPRAPRLVAEGVPYHVVQRGNHRERLFFCEADCRQYLEFLRRYAGRHELRVAGYCLMPNHVHLVVIPSMQASLPRGVGETQNLYSRWLNRRLERVGHCWVRRYYSAPMDRDHFLTALRYVDRNPVRAGMVKSALEFEWSSAAAHVSGADPTGVVDMAAWREHVHAHSYWGEILESARNEQTREEAIRAGTRTGRAVGPEAFQREIAQRLGRPWPPKRGGRPRKPLASAAHA